MDDGDLTQRKASKIGSTANGAVETIPTVVSYAHTGGCHQLCTQARPKVRDRSCQCEAGFPGSVPTITAKLDRTKARRGWSRRGGRELGRRQGLARRPKHVHMF